MILVAKVVDCWWLWPAITRCCYGGSGCSYNDYNGGDVGCGDYMVVEVVLLMVIARWW